MTKQEILDRCSEAARHEFRNGNTAGHRRLRETATGAELAQVAAMPANRQVGIIRRLAANLAAPAQYAHYLVDGDTVVSIPTA